MQYLWLSFYLGSHSIGAIWLCLQGTYEFLDYRPITIYNIIIPCWLWGVVKVLSSVGNHLQTILFYCYLYIIFLNTYLSLIMVEDNLIFFALMSYSLSRALILFCVLHVLHLLACKSITEYIALYICNILIALLN